MDLGRLEIRERERKGRRRKGRCTKSLELMSSRETYLVVDWYK